MKGKISLFFASLIAVLFGYQWLFDYQIGRSVKAEWWLVDVQHKKQSLANQSDGDRIIIVSGSNGLFGINSKTMSEMTGKKVVNLAMHGSIDISYYKNLIAKNARKGDIVIMPLEYAFYFRDNKYSDWFVNNMLAWGGDYLNSLSPFERIDFISHVPVSRVFEGVLSTDARMTTPVEYIDAYKGNPNGHNYGYRYTSVNAYGDMNLDPAGLNFVEGVLKKTDEMKDALSYGKDDRKLSDYSMRQLHEIESLVAKKGGNLYLTWPATIKNKYFNENDKQSIEFVKALRKSLNGEGFKTICKPFYANLAPELFLDSVYHLNATGAEIRSERLAGCINGEVPK